MSAGPETVESGKATHELSQETVAVSAQTSESIDTGTFLGERRRLCSFWVATF